MAEERGTVERGSERFAPREGEIWRHVGGGRGEFEVLDAPERAPFHFEDGTEMRWRIRIREIDRTDPEPGGGCWLDESCFDYIERVARA